MENTENEINEINENLNTTKDQPIIQKQGKNFNPDDYIELMMIGHGNFSELYLVENKHTKILYAMKTFNKTRVEQLKKQEDVLMEKHVMEKISSHENVIGYYGSAKDDFCLYILYEYINGGELWKRCVVYGLPSEKLIKYYFLQILDGISHMHSFNIVHRDIKVRK
jgi:serine/threonine protein kinase